MPDKRSHRGAAPEDDKLFGPSEWSALRLATSDLCWLLNRGYALPSAVELVGNRYYLAKRQRMAVARCACSDEAFKLRECRRVELPQLRGQELWLDGYNVLTAVESAMAGGVILLGCDGCVRDLASMHARYRKVEETLPALELVGEMTTNCGVSKCRWWLDRPVSNSGRLKKAIVEVATRTCRDWEVELVYNPDKILAETDQIIATSDSAILDRCQRWINLARLVISQRVPQARVVDLCVRRKDLAEKESVKVE